MKRTVLTALSILLSFALLAAPRSEKEAREIAFNHFAQKASPRVKAKALSSKPELVLAGTSSSLLGKGYKAKAQAPALDAAEALYVYNLGSDAFVIVSGDDVSAPVLAYSNDGAFATEGMPEQIKGWLQTYADEMAYATCHNARSFTLKEESRRVESKYPASVAPIMKYDGEAIQWDQNTPFCNDCPKYQGSTCVAGCVATALAQIVYYHRWPEKGQGGTKAYITKTYGISQDYNFSGSSFDYDKMLPHYYNGKYSGKQGTAAANLTHAIGVAVDMDYAPEGSGALSMSVGNAMIKYFNYDKNLHYALRDFYSLDEWLDMIKKEISEGRPICYAGSSTSVGHQFVFEGYDKDNLVYINWGWAGMSDGYFRLSALSPSSLGTGGGSSTSGGFIFNQAMWLGMQAPTETSVPSSFFIIYNTSIETSKTRMMLGENFTLTTKNYYNGSVDFNGEFCMILEDADGNQSELATPIAKKVLSGDGGISQVGVLSISGVIPVGLPDGNYTLYLATRLPGEPRWSRMRANAGYNDRFAVEVAGGNVNLSTVVTEPMGEGSLVSDHAIYTRCRSQFTANLRNTGTSEYFGIAHVAVYREANGATELIALCGEQQVSLPVGENVEVVFKAPIEALPGKTLSQGNYKACVVVEHQDRYFQMSDDIDITVKRIPSGMASLQLDNLEVEATEVSLDEVLYGKIDVTNTRSVFSGNIGIIVFKQGSNMGSSYWEKELFLETKASSSMYFHIPVQWLPGKYKASIRFGEGFTTEIGNFDFEVLDNYTTDISSAMAKDEVLEEQYFSLSGTRLSSRPDAGLYIARTKTKDGVKSVKINAGKK